MGNITIQDAARKYGCTQSRLYTAIKRNKLRSVRDMGRVYLDEDEMDKLFGTQTDVPSPVLTLNDYQKAAMTTRTEQTYGTGAIVYPTLGLTGEAGEVADKVKKVLRGDNGTREFDEEAREAIAYELGDVLWYAAALAKDLGYDLEDIARMNLRKLQDRQSRQVIHGNGDNR